MANEHRNIRLEKNGTVIAYLAPNFEVNPVASNDLKPGGGKPLPRNRPTRIRDLRVISDEVTVQGEFHDTHDPDSGTAALPSGHISDLESLFGTTPVTARMQVNRIRDFLHTTGGPYELYEGNDQYTATTESEVDWANGIFPTVFVDQFRPPSMGGHRRMEYMIKMKVGTERG